MFFTVKMRTLLFTVTVILLAGTAIRLLMPAAQPVMGEAEQNEIVYILDAGHGGEDGGAVSADGVKESGINLSVTKRLDALLRFMGRKTLLTRTEDVSIYSDGAETLRQKKASDLKNRVTLVNNTPNAVLISIHQNSLPTSPRVQGAQVFYGTAAGSAELSESIQNVLNECVNNAEKQAKKIDDSVYLMKHVTRPAILIECGFLSNTEEAMRLQQAEHQLKLTTAIVAGLMNTEEEP